MTLAPELARTRLLGACGVCAALSFAIADGVGGIFTPDYSMWSDAISELVERDAPLKGIVDVFLLVYHALVIPFAVGIRRAIYPANASAPGPVLLGAAGFAGVLLTLFFPCDPGCELFVSLRGTLHIFIAIPMGISILVAIWIISGAMKASQRWAGYTAYARATALIGVALAAITVVLAESGHVGIFERLLTWTYLLWYFFVGLAIAKGNVGSPQVARKNQSHSVRMHFL